MTQKEFEQTLIALRPDMVRVAIAFFHNDEDAEDVVQEVYAWPLQRGWHQGDKLVALAIRATKNLCVSVWRRKRLRETEPLDGITGITYTLRAKTLWNRNPRCWQLTTMRGLTSSCSRPKADFGCPSVFALRV